MDDSGISAVSENKNLNSPHISVEEEPQRSQTQERFTAERTPRPSEPVEKAPQQTKLRKVPKSNQFNNGCRHFKALMNKNAINWRRTLFGSLMEVVCPIFLMFLLVMARYLITPSEYDAADIYLLKKPFYPTATLDQDQWTSENFFTTKEGIDQIPFMKFSNYSSLVGYNETEQFYSPLVDPLGPYYFYPPHCYNKDTDKKSPIVAYVSQGNQIEADIVEQLELLFAKQRDLVTYAPELVGALQNPGSAGSYNVMIKALDGGSNDQQVQLLKDFGVSQEFLDVLQFVQISNIIPASNFEEIEKQSEQIAQQASESQDQALQDLGAQLNLTPQQTATLAQTTQQAIQSGTPLDQAQIDQLATDFGLDQTQKALLDTSLSEVQNQAQNTERLQQLVNGDITVNEFTDASSDSIDEIAASIGLNQTEIDELKIQIDSPASNLNRLMQSAGASQVQITQLQDLAQTIAASPTQDIGQTLQQIQDSSIDLIADSFGLDQQQTDLFKSLGDVIDQADIAGALINATTDAGFTDVQIEQGLKEMNEASEEFEKYFNKTSFQYFGQFELRKFETTQALEDYIVKDEDPNQGICFGFKIMENSDQDYELELFFNDLWPDTSISIPNQKLPSYDPSFKDAQLKEYQLYVNHGYSYMQNWVANTLLRRKTANPDAQITAMIVPSKLSTYNFDSFKLVLEAVLTLFMLLAYVPVLYRTIYRIVFEKVTKTKESMRIMGMADLPYWSSWFCYYTIVNTVIVFSSWGILNINVFSPKSAGLLLAVLWVYGQSLFGLILIAQSLFSRPRSAAIITTLVYFGLTLLTLLIDDAETPKEAKWGVCFFLPTVGMCQTIIAFVQMDASGLGVTIEQTWTWQYQNFSVQEGIILMCIAGFNTFLLGCYLEAVLPKTYGQRKHPCFFLGFPCKGRRHLCKSSSNGVGLISPSDQDIEISGREFETKYLKPENYEPAPREIVLKELQGDLLKIQDLQKKYNNGFQAVDGLNVKMYADQIFVLLGHNGAGKTTTLSMLTGLLNQTQGQATVFGTDIFEQMQEVRKFMGVCPQYDILFEFLTVEEHISFFYDLKGSDPNATVKKANLEKLMTDVGIIKERDALAYQLSGGSKRKLSVAIALCGNSKFVLLDEPTSGMDLQARRQLWNMLKEYKKDRIIVLTTHYMDEADILGDRIGIMNKGKMTCLGSSIFLKNKFGLGYNLTVVKTRTDETNEQLIEYMQEHLGPEVKLQSEVQSEMTIQIPQSYSGKFGLFFHHFDQYLEDLGVESYGISISTLEEVFIRVGHLDDPSDASVLNASDFSVPQAEPDGPKERKTLEVDNQNDVDHTFQALGIEEAKKQQMMSIQSARPHSTDSKLTGRSQRRAHSNRVAPVPLQPVKKLTFGYQKFNMKDNQKELDETFWNSLSAVLFKRVANKKRNWKALLYELALPAMILVVGFTTALLSPSWRSDSVLMKPERLSVPQPVTINQLSYSDGQDLTKFAENLPNFDSSFRVSYDAANSTFNEFGQFIVDQASAKAPFSYGSYQIYEADPVAQKYRFSSFVNITSQDATALYPQFMYESILKTALNNPDFKFTLRTTPYPPTIELVNRWSKFDATLIIFITAIGYSVMITSIVSYLVVERMDGLKHLQIVSGMQKKAYWVGNFIIDFVKMQFTIVLTIAMFFGFNMGVTSAWLTYLVFPFGILPFTYVTSFVFSADSAAQSFTMFFHFLVMAILSSVVQTLKLFLDTDSSVPTQVIGDTLGFLFKVIPTYPLSSSVFCDVQCELLVESRLENPGSGFILNSNVWAIENNTSDILAMFIHFFVWSFILFLIEKGSFDRCRIKPNKRIQKPEEVDSDVEKEFYRVKLKHETGTQETIHVNGLKKVYKTQSKSICKSETMAAVSNLSFSVQAGECFALLGVNGAGKSTTFSALTSAVEPTSGSIRIGGFDIGKYFDQARKLIGYCPQQNMVFDAMSVEEHLWYYARIKGIPRSKRTDLIEQTIKKLGLQEFRKNAAGTLSGGNQRKLCVAQALVGNPPVILLDEPSAGMDPESRRFMWSVVASIAQEKSSAIMMTTHSMEEAEALSTKMGIMAKGGIFECFGSAQHLKTKFSTGYVIELKIKQIDEQYLWDAVKQYFVDSNGKLDLAQTTVFDEKIIAPIMAKIDLQSANIDIYREIHTMVSLYNCIDTLCESFTEVDVLEQYGNYMRLRVQRGSNSIGQVFGYVERLKIMHDVCSYSVSQTTLEEIFQALTDKNYNEKVTKFVREYCDDQQYSKFHLLTIKSYEQWMLERERQKQSKSQLTPNAEQKIEEETPGRKSICQSISDVMDVNKGSGEKVELAKERSRSIGMASVNSIPSNTNQSVECVTRKSLLNQSDSLQHKSLERNSQAEQRRSQSILVGQGESTPKMTQSIELTRQGLNTKSVAIEVEKSKEMLIQVAAQAEDSLDQVIGEGQQVESEAQEAEDRSLVRHDSQASSRDEH